MTASDRSTLTFLFGSACFASLFIGPSWALELLVPLYQFPYEGADDPAPLWEDFNAVVTNGDSITGVLNPNSGPMPGSDVDKLLYDNILTFLNKGSYGDGTGPQPKLLCYVPTGFGDATKASEVTGDIDTYLQLFPTACDGIFFDEAVAAPDATVLALYESYYEYAIEKGLPSVFNPGAASNPAYYTLGGGTPGVVSFENFYSKVRRNGMPRALGSVANAQDTILVHSTLDLDGTSPGLKALQAFVKKADCAGWGSIYFTDDPLIPNPFDNEPSYFAALADAVYGGQSGSCPDDDESQLRIMVPLLPSSSSSDFGVIEGVLSPNDYGDVVTVVMDLSAFETEGASLRDAGARVLCYIDAKDMDTATVVNELATVSAVQSSQDVCGGFYFANYDSATVNSESVYAEVQVRTAFARSTVVFEPLDPTTPDLTQVDWDQVSFAGGRVIVATVVDGSSGTVELPGASSTTRPATAAIVTGFSGDTDSVMEAIAACGYGYAYVTEATDFAALSSSWSALVTRAETLSFSSSDTCVPLSAQETPCGSDPEASFIWSGTANQLTVSSVNGEGCVDMTRAKGFFDGLGLVDKLVEAYFHTCEMPRKVSDGVWELNASLLIKTGVTLNIHGGQQGDCDELRVLSQAERNRIFGRGGQISISETKIFGWKDGDVDTAVTAERGYITSQSCKGSEGQGGMAVVASEIGYLGYGGAVKSGLSWQDTCSEPGEAAVVDSEIKGMRTGLYANGVQLSVKNVQVDDSDNHGIHVRNVQGSIEESTVTNSGNWAIFVQSSPGIRIEGNDLSSASSGLSLQSFDGVEVIQNIFPRGRKSVRIQTVNTIYRDNTGDGAFPESDSASQAGLKVRNDGCFDSSSTSPETVADDYIKDNVC